MNFSLADSLADCPIIAAAKNDEGLEQALSSDSPVVFLLYGSVCSVAGQTRRVAAAGKVPFVHADLIDGLSAREVAVDFTVHDPLQGVVTWERALFFQRHAEVGAFAIVLEPV